MILQIDGQNTSGLYRLDLTTAEATPVTDRRMTGITGVAVSMGK
ncbi:MAG: hypothetical protein AAF761_10835 [Pseudomonadota bacterium]